MYMSTTEYIQGKFYIPREKAGLVRRMKEILRREGRSLSSWIMEQIEAYVRKHEPGNPQLLITSFLPGVARSRPICFICEKTQATWTGSCYNRDHRIKRYPLCDNCRQMAEESGRWSDFQQLDVMKE